jgi:bifunctional non-homologous end joining protein LigD
MLALLGTTLPTGPQWSYEVKWDGYRALIEKRGSRVVIRSRRGADLTGTYPAVAAAARTVDAADAVLDGEIVALDAEGRPSFQALQHRQTAGRFLIAYYAFDILARDGRDLTGEPLAVRRTHLAQVVAGSGLLLSEPLPGTPEQIVGTIRGFGLEGVIAKRVDSRYEPGHRSGAWMKVKFARRQEFVVGGFRPDGASVDALVVGYYEGRTLMAAGKVRAGLTPLLRRQLYEALVRLTTEACPFANLPTSKKGRWGEGITAEDMLTLTWVKPRMVADIEFTEWTAGGSLCHAAFVGLRTDKRPRDVVRETSGPATGRE